MRHALVKDGEIIEFRSYAPNVDQSGLALGKPRQLPVEMIVDEFDPVSQVQEGPFYEVETARVVERYTSRTKNADEIAAMIAEKDTVIEDEFARLCNLPITHTVGGVDYLFHADADARENIRGVLQMYNEADRLGASLPDPRPWTPKGAVDAVSITRAELATLGMAIGLRKDALYTIKKLRQKALAEMTDPVDIDAVDPLAGWEIP